MDEVVVRVHTTHAQGDCSSAPPPACSDCCVVARSGAYIAKGYLMDFAFKSQSDTPVFSCYYDATPLSVTTPDGGIILQASR